MPKLHPKNRKNNDKKISKIKRLIAGLLILITLGNYLGYFPLEDYIIQRALAQAENGADNAEEEPNNPVENEARNKLGLIAILVEEGLMDDFAIRNRVTTYAESAQSRMPHSKSLILEVWRTHL